MFKFIKEDFKKHSIIYTFLIIIFFVLIIFLMKTGGKSIDGGSYDYCVEWSNFIDRDNLIYNCYDLVNLEFTCDYKIMKNNQLMVKPILNITKNDEGEIIEIIYDEPIYHNCTRWLKSKK